MNGECLSSDEEERLRFNQRLLQYLNENSLRLTSKKKRPQTPQDCPSWAVQYLQENNLTCVKKQQQTPHSSPFCLDVLGDILVHIAAYVSDLGEWCNDAVYGKSPPPVPDDEAVWKQFWEQLSSSDIEFIDRMNAMAEQQNDSAAANEQTSSTCSF
jgi:hypothetical protein